MGALGVIGVSGQSQAGGDIEVEVFSFKELALAQGIEQAPGHNQGRLFAGLGQKDHEFVAAIAEGVINEAEVRLDEVSDFGQQLGADQLAMRVIHALKVAQLTKDPPKLVAEP